MAQQSVRGVLEEHQVPIYLLAIGAGIGLGALLPGVSQPLEVAVEPVIAALLLVTFHGVPLRELGGAAQDRRFLLTLLAVNFVAVPLLVLAITRPLAGTPELLVPALLVLLAPCVDYVIVFTAVAGGAKEQLLAATPLLMLVQMLALPVLVPLLAGDATTGLFTPAPFLRALILLILLPLLAAALIQRLAPRWDLSAAMIPLMMLTLLTVVSSQTPRVLGMGTTLLALVPVYVAFLVLATAAGIVISRLARLDVPSARALTFSGATRNSLVVLPLALALPIPVAPAAVVTQTLVELLGMVLLVRILPQLIRDGRRPPGRR
ncbi:arsenic resistance protein [Brachybacterium fresconis]|uniref:ACR3 family arsenite efflux pump ArsB n=1 Tax=Brachybacterium fresconis TaxID=173363 RepID=A0ABS4YNN5_9MICO|nr:arsenic resistance protein [Brachybacterium fresconis]MBP2410410.1 ACR3 family arsenite efflux pump ArsB [Brachybacterium fresconis]